MGPTFYQSQTPLEVIKHHWKKEECAILDMNECWYLSRKPNFGTNLGLNDPYLGPNTFSGAWKPFQLTYHNYLSKYEKLVKTHAWKSR